MWKFLAQRWFLISLTGLIAFGLVLGLNVPHVKQVTDRINPLLTTATILFLMSFSLETRQLQAALRTPLPVALGAVLNIGMAPLIDIGLMPLQQPLDFRYGLLIASIVPCTMAAASVWTRKAHGNDAISLLVTLVTNTLSIATIPVWLMLATYWFPLSSIQSATPAFGTGPILDLHDTVVELLAGVLIPILAGQILRQPAAISDWVTRHRIAISAIAQVLILVMVWAAAVKGGYRLARSQLNIGLTQVAVVWGSVIVVHLATLYAGLILSRSLHVSRGDQIAVAFAGSQKTLPVGLLLSDTLSRQAGLSFAVFPMLMYHASQLFIDTVIAERFAVQEPSPQPLAPARQTS